MSSTPSIGSSISAPEGSRPAQEDSKKSVSEPSEPSVPWEDIHITDQISERLIEDIAYDVSETGQPMNLQQSKM